jgi:regulator of sirC expression with transglutaminase-like and TPR domain
MARDRLVDLFAGEVSRPETDIDLARAALLIARMEYPELHVESYIARLDRMAAVAGVSGDPLRCLHRLREYLFEEQGFSGNRAEYYDPRNSFLNDVLDRRLGIPITLSLVLIEVGRRAGLALDGIGLPGHFIAGVHVGGSRVLLDPFNGGAIVTPTACAELVVRATGRRVALDEEAFAPISKRQLLTRMLQNLKAIWCRREDWARAVRVIDLLLVLDPGAGGERRDRGTALANLGEYERGFGDWERYLSEFPNAPDGDEMRGRLRRMRQRLAQLN